MKILSFPSIASLILATPLAGLALNARPLQPNEHATNLPGVTTIEAPPAGFDPVSASDEDLKYHGFPPRPNQSTEPKAYASWVRAMHTSATRLVPRLETTTIVHAPAGTARNAGANTARNEAPPLHDNALISSTLSGYYSLSGATSYGASSYYYIVTDFVVPVAVQHGCSGTWAYASEWSGIDGFGPISGDVLQAGVEFDAYCFGGVNTPYYAAWYEWYPNGEVRISGFPVTAGDDIFEEVWHTSATQGYVYLQNYTTGQAVELGFPASPGHSLVGDSAEWIVEDPGVMIDFGTIPFWHAYAYTESGVQGCSTNGTQIVQNVLPIIVTPTPIGACSFVDVY